MNLLKSILAFVSLMLIVSCAPKQTSTSLPAEQPSNTSAQELKLNSEELKDADISKEPAVAGDYLAGEIYLKLKDDTIDKLSSFNAEKGQLGKHPQLQDLIDTYKITSVKSAFPGLDSKVYRIKFPQDANVEKLIQACQKYPFVEYAEQIPLNK